MDGLKACPFCGASNAKTVMIRDGRKVVCGSCGASSGSKHHGPLSMPSADARAIAAWNTRPERPAEDVIGQGSLTATGREPVSGGPIIVECHGLDTPERVCFYEQDFYVLSNFSAFRLLWKGLTFDTLEAAYHWEKFPDDISLQIRIRTARSAHEAFKLAEEFRSRRRPDWDDVKVDIMRELLFAKVAQHEYVRRKLLATGDRELVENSWRDDFWGWGPNRDGQNMLGKLWMEVRAAITESLGA